LGDARMAQFAMRKQVRMHRKITIVAPPRKRLSRTMLGTERLSQQVSE
jgi:hypothetical protein